MTANSKPSTPSTEPQDVRMRGFAHRNTVDQALAWLDAHSASLPKEAVPTAGAEAVGRVLAADVHSRVDVPGFNRAMMDGFAVRACDTLGASEYNRLPLEIVGQVLPGVAFKGDLNHGQAVRIMTGAPLPDSADAVLPVEKVEIESDRVYAQDEVSPGKHVGLCGEDVVAGSRVLARGRRLRPQDLGVLSSIGVSQVEVVRRPRVRLAITGNELLPAGSLPKGYRISDANGPMLAGLVKRDGGLVTDYGILVDEPNAILSALQDKVEVVIVSGGSSVGQDDHAPVLVAQHGKLAVHGIAMRPSSPAGMGYFGDRLVFLLPGNPVSCLCAYDFFAGRAIRALGGRSRNWPYRKVILPLRRKLVSTVGRVDYARVSLVDRQVEPLAISGASVLSTATRADGFVVIPGDSEGYPSGAEVGVYLYDDQAIQDE